MRFSALRITSVLLPLALLGVASRAIAHGAKIQYEATQAYAITATYDSGEPMAEAQVAVFSPDDPSTPWMTGTTNDAGEFLFTPPNPGNWEVQVRQAGHGDIVVIPVEEPDMAIASAAASSPAPDASPEPVSSTPAESTDTVSTPDALSTWQKGIMAGSVVWGCVGTALFFSKKQTR